MTLEELRKEIDAVDAHILQLLNQRAQCVIQVGKIKQKNEMEILVPVRETAIRRRLSSLNQGPLTDDLIHEIFQTIIDSMKELQKR
ncbi:chorismate mutase [Deltaproteobacteria bacterium TL4]